MIRCSQAIRVLRCRRTFCSSALHDSLLQVQTLENDSVDCFQKNAFQPAIPRRLPRGSLNFPAQKKWFSEFESSLEDVWLDTGYFESFGDSIVPLEMTHESGDESETTFETLQGPLKHFMQWIQHARRERVSTQTSTRLYIAQADLADLPQALRDDVPTPQVVNQAGKGDIYASSLWMGLAPTYTPLHRDPNPNMFAQLAGGKTVRLCSPEVGTEVFESVQRRLGRNVSSTIRGQEMMVGEERRELERVIWNMGQNMPTISKHFYEAILEAGDALFIPKGWWHSVKGKGKGINVSVNWWFR